MNDQRKYKKVRDLSNKIIVFSGIFLMVLWSSILDVIAFTIFLIGFLILIYSEKLEKEYKQTNQWFCLR